MTFSRVVLPAPFGPMSPVNSPARTVKETSTQDLPAAQADADSVQLKELLPGHHRCSVETLLVTALFRALTSASIQVW